MEQWKKRLENRLNFRSFPALHNSNTPILHKACLDIDTLHKDRPAGDDQND